MDSRYFLIVVFIIINGLIKAQNDSTEIIQKEDKTRNGLQLAYQNIQADNLYGATTIIKSENFNLGPILSPMELIIGKSAGLLVYRGGIMPNALPKVNLRGNLSFYSVNNPIYIVDGIPLESNDLSFLAIDDIEEFVIIRDALAYSLYGTRASGGAVIINTKRARSDDSFHVTYSGYLAVSSLAKKLKVFSGPEFRQIVLEKKDIFDTDTYEKLGVENTDWQNEIFRNAVSHNHHIGISGAYRHLPYRISLAYADQSAILKNSGIARTTGTINLNPAFFNNTLKMNIIGKASFTKNNFGNEGAIQSAIYMDPTQAIFDGNAGSSGYFQWENHGANLGTPNPVEQVLEADNKSDVKRFIGSIQFNYHLPFIPGLQANLNLSTDYSSTNGQNNRPTSSPLVLTAPIAWGRLEDYNNRITTRLIDFYLNYNREIHAIKSVFNISAGYTNQFTHYEASRYLRGVVDELHPYQLSDSSSISVENTGISLFGNSNFSVMGKYIFNTTLRKEGSSKFIEEHKWALFPSYAFIWKINEENFLADLEFISSLRLRLGYGITGQTYNYEGSETFYNPGQINVDPNITWEKIATENIGIDFGFFNDQIDASIDLFRRMAYDVITMVNVPSGTNFSNVLLSNIGEIENHGIEASLNLKPISKKEISLNLAFNFTFYSSTVKKLQLTEDPDYIGILYGNAYTGLNQLTRVGEAIQSFFVNRQVYDTNGNPIEGLYVDLSGDGGVVAGDNQDKYVYKKPEPNYFFGFSMNFNLKRFELSSSLHADIGNYIYNMTAASASYDQMQQIGYWKNMPAYLNDTKFMKQQFMSDYFVQNGSFLNIDHISLAYSFSKQSTEKAKFRIYATAQNPLLLTKYKGINPEIYAGIDRSDLPRVRTFLIGLSINM
jgi:iron complex outermembrane receptor protein